MTTRTFGYVSIHPAVVEEYLSVGVMKTAQEKSLLSYEIRNLRNFSVDKHGSVDDRPYGGGDGMVMRPEPLASSLESLSNLYRPLVVMPSPAGMLFSQEKAKEMAQKTRDIIFVCGRFGGIDQRFIDRYVHEEISLGDYVIAGGELAALVMSEAIARLIPGVLGHKDSADFDSFGPACHGYLEAPVYTRPREFDGQTVPAVLTSGDHDAIRKWRDEMSLNRTKKRRPDLL